MDFQRQDGEAYIRHLMASYPVKLLMWLEQLLKRPVQLLRAHSNNETERLPEEAELREFRPWKHLGYKVFSRLMASDQTFFIVRRFGALNARVALSLQDEIVELEDQLNFMDTFYSRKDGPNFHNGTFRYDVFPGNRNSTEGPGVHPGDRNNTEGPSVHPGDRNSTEGQNVHNETLSHNPSTIGPGDRNNMEGPSVHPADRNNIEGPSIHPADRNLLVRKIVAKKLAKYNDFLDGYAQLASRGQPHPNDIAGVRHWLRTYRKDAINRDESEYINYDDDLVAVHPNPRSWLCRVVEKTSFLEGLFSRRPPKDHVTLEYECTRWSNDKRIEKLSSGLISIAGLAMLIGPLWILAHNHGTAVLLKLISAFILVFFVVVAVATTARIFEALAATAAYAAVLVFFLEI